MSLLERAVDYRRVTQDPVNVKGLSEFSLVYLGVHGNL